MGNLKELAYELERKAKAKADFKMKAGYFWKAARTWKRIGGENGNWKWKFNMADYSYAKALDHFHSGEFEKSKRFSLQGEKLFLALGKREKAIHCANRYIYACSKEEKGEIPTASFLELQEELLERYKDFSSHEAYIWWNHRYLNAKGKIYRREMRFGEAAECYKNSAEAISKINEDRGQHYRETYYKCMAMENKDNKAVFEDYINKAIEISEKRGDLGQVYYHIGLKYEILGLHSSFMEEQIEFLRRSKENYYKAKEKISAKRAESLYIFSLSQKALEDGKYEEALDLLEETARIVEDPEYPSRIPFPRDLESERCLCNAYLCFSRGEFSESVVAFENWLRMNKEKEKTIRYASNEKIKMCIELCSKEDLSEEDLYHMDEVFKFVREKQLGLKLYSICSLTYAYISLRLHDIMKKETLDKIKLEIIKKIATDKVADNMKWLLDIGIVTDELSLLLRLPPVFKKKFQNCTYRLNEVLPDDTSDAFLGFYVFLENYLRIVVLFKAGICWRNDWESRLKEEVVRSKKPFDRFTLGDLVYSLRFFKDNKPELCKNIPEQVFDLLEKHSEIRNKLSHQISVELPEIDIRKDILRLVCMLSSSFPTCIRIYNTKRSPWYDAEMLWIRLPSLVRVFSEEKLSESDYFIEPIWEVEEDIRPIMRVPIPPIESIKGIFRKD